MGVATREQPAPVSSTGRPAWEMVIEDMRERDRAGRERYGVPPQAGNGRDPLMDAYQEALDLCVCLRQAIEERRAAASGADGRLGLPWQEVIGRYLGPRPRRALREAGVVTARDLAAGRPSRLLAVRGCGETTVREIYAACVQAGLSAPHLAARCDPRRRF